MTETIDRNMTYDKYDSTEESDNIVDFLLELSIIYNYIEFLVSCLTWILEGNRLATKILISLLRYRSKQDTIFVAITHFH